jgi:hypothetical protein
MTVLDDLRVEFLQNLKQSGVNFSEFESALQDLTALRLHRIIEKPAVILLSQILASQDKLALADAKGAARGYTLGVGLVTPC